MTPPYEKCIFYSGAAKKGEFGYLIYITLISWKLIHLMH